MTNARETSRRIGEELRAGGLRKGGVVMVHSSLSSLGFVNGGPETVIQGFLSALGPDGTLLMPALSYEIVTVNNPMFDVRRTPSNVGAIPEYFRTRQGTIRSVHPTHSVCGTGRLAENILKQHTKDDTPCGDCSPFSQLLRLEGQIVMLGCGLRPNTSMHAIEEHIDPPYLYGPRIKYTLTDMEGKKSEKVYRVHNFAGWAQRYDRVAYILRPPNLRVVNVLEARVHIVETAALWRSALKHMKRNSLFFVDKKTL